MSALHLGLLAVSMIMASTSSFDARNDAWPRWQDPVYRAAAVDRDGRTQRRLMKRLLVRVAVFVLASTMASASDIFTRQDPHVTHLVLFNTNNTANASTKHEETVRRALANLGGVSKATVCAQHTQRPCHCRLCYAERSGLKKQNKNVLDWCLAVLSGAPADVTNVEQSMHSGLPTIILSDTGGTADAVALKLDESLKDKKELDAIQAEQAKSMPKVPDDLFAESQKEHLNMLYKHIQAIRQEKQGKQQRNPRSYSSTRASKPKTNDSIQFENPVDADGTGYVQNPLDDELADYDDKVPRLSANKTSKAPSPTEDQHDPFDCWVKGAQRLTLCQRTSSRVPFSAGGLVIYVLEPSDPTGKENLMTEMLDMYLPEQYKNFKEWTDAAAAASARNKDDRNPGAKYVEIRRVRASQHTAPRSALTWLVSCVFVQVMYIEELEWATAVSHPNRKLIVFVNDYIDKWLKRAETGDIFPGDFRASTPL